MMKLADSLCLRTRMMKLTDNPKSQPLRLSLAAPLSLALHLALSLHLSAHLSLLCASLLCTSLSLSPLRLSLSSAPLSLCASLSAPLSLSLPAVGSN